MKYYTRLINNLNELKLEVIAMNMDNYLVQISEGKLDYIDAMYELTQLQLEENNKKEIEYCIKWGAFPGRKTINDFDFSFQPSINKEQINTFMTLRFIERAENILFVGSCGVGKTHLATAIGLEAASHKKQARFINCSDLLLVLKKARQEGELEKKLTLYSRYQLLIIDEVGYLPMDSESANLLFQLINKRYEKKSTIITTNKPLSKWGELFNDNVLANAILDRLVHHSHIINITGRSYRTKDLGLQEMEESKNEAITR